MTEDFDKNEIIDTLGENVSSWLYSLDWTIEELSEKTGLSTTTISKIANKKITAIPRVDTLIKLSDAFAIPIDDLLFDDKHAGLDDLRDMLMEDQDSVDDDNMDADIDVPEEISIPQADSQLDNKQLKKLVKQMVIDELVPLNKELPDSLDLTVDAIKKPNPDKVWLDQMDKIGELLRDFTVDFFINLAPNVDIEEGILSMFTDRLADFQQAFDRAKSAIDEIGFSSTDIVKLQPGQEMVYSYHQGFFQMGIIQLVDIFSDVISMFLGIVTSQGYITEEEVVRYLPSMKEIMD